MNNATKKRLTEITEYWKILEFIGQNNIKLQNDDNKQLLRKLRRKEKNEQKNLSKKKLEVFHYFSDPDMEKKLIDVVKRLKKSTADEIFNHDTELMESFNVSELLTKDKEELDQYPVAGDVLFFVIGAVKRNDVVDFLRSNFYDSENLPELPELSYKDEETIAWFTFKAKADGSFDDKSFTLSPLLWAINYWKKNEVERTQKFLIDLEEYEKANSELEEIIDAVKERDGSTKVNDILPQLYEEVYKTYIKDNFPNFGKELYHEGFFEYNRYADEKAKNKDKPEDYTQMSSSFFKDDLNRFESMIADGYIDDDSPYERALCDFVQSGYYALNGIEITERTSVSAKEDPKHSFEFFRSVLDIMRAPLGKWPAKFKPSLMQQAAINLAIDEENNRPIFSVNGPPGTGKTTLLKEILSEYIVRRAYLLSQEAENSPDEAFRALSFNYGKETKNGKAYIADAPNYFEFKDDRINNYSVLVTSCNNSAVENITIELPKLDDILQSLAPYESEESGGNDPYAEINKGLNEISALFDPARSEDTEKVKVFNYEKAETEECCAGDILFTRISDSLLNDPQMFVKAKKDNAKSGKTELPPVTRTWGLISAPLGRKANIEKYCRLVLKPFLEAYKSPEKREEHKKKYIDVRAKFLDQYDLVLQMRGELAEICNECTDSYKEYKLPEKYTRGADKMDVIDKRFIESYCSDNEKASTKAQLSNPWATDRYNREREKLFYYACKLHKEFCAASDAIRQNIENLLVYWRQSDETVFINSKEKEDVFPVLLQSLFLITPVLSTTFASAHQLLKDINEPGVIGVLIVDESGQAQPHMAIGSLMRCRKAIIVGDPKQVEPVVTAEADMFKQIMTSDVLKAYKEKAISVQSFADYINPYGTFLGSDAERQWVGCPLVVHRRCADPMYSISNSLSYDNTMKNSRRTPKDGDFILPRSCWIDVKGSCSGSNRFVETQGEIVIRLLKKAFEGGKLPKLYIISPFTTVVSGIREMLKKNEEQQFSENKENFKKWLNDDNIGTVHTFQGKGTNEVIFLLGCDEKSMGAVNWVNKNIVNVAATRAKERFYVIGDREVWINNGSLKVAEEEIKNTISAKELNELLPSEETVQTTLPIENTQTEAPRNSRETDDEVRARLSKISLPDSYNEADGAVELPLNCPDCGKALKLRLGKNNTWFISCSGFPRCQNRFSLHCSHCRNNTIIKKNSKTNQLFLICLDSDCKRTSSFPNNAEAMRKMLGLTEASQRE